MKRFQRGLATLLCISMTGAMFPVPISAEVTSEDTTWGTSRKAICKKYKK